MSTSPDPVTSFLSRFTSRDVAHFVVPYVSAVVPLIVWTSASTVKASLFSAIPALASVLYRQVFPHSAVSASEVATAVSQVESVLAKTVAAAPAPAPAQTAP